MTRTSPNVRTFGRRLDGWLGAGQVGRQIRAEARDSDTVRGPDLDRRRPAAGPARAAHVGGPRWRAGIVCRAGVKE
jgi:hypothetical protein